MVTEFQKKLGGWIVELVAPALIMIMTGSLTFFLVEVCYYGDYLGRVRWVLGCFIFASVLTSRISITEGSDKAALYSLILGAATLFVLIRLSNFPLVLGVGFIGIIWFFNSRLTWDCTLLDNSRDNTERGLLSRLSRKSSSEPNYDEADSRQVVSTGSNSETAAVAWKSRFLSRKKVPNTPGVWVLLFSLAAFPIFGIGQGFVIEEIRRQNSFFYFCTYLAAGLGLLVTTALIGLQRYLQKRNATMPNSVALSWVVGGLAMILAILIAAWILPRPYSEFSIAENPFRFDKRSDLGTSRFSFGAEGKLDSDTSGSGVNGQRKSSPQGSSQSKEDGSVHSSSGKSSSGKSSSGKSSSGKSSSGKSSSGKSSSGKSSSGKSSSGKSSSDKSSSGESDSGGRTSNSKSKAAARNFGDERKSTSEKNQDQESEPSSSRSDKSGSTANNDQKGANEDKEGQKSSTQRIQNSSKSSGTKNNNRNQNTTSSQQSRSPSFFTPSIRGIFWIIQMLFLIIVGIVALVLGWRYRKQLWRRLLDFIEEMKRFWASLWARKKTAERRIQEASQTAMIKRPKSFSQFVNPFRGEKIAELSNEQLVKYSFDAVEAWGRERGVERIDHQTPHEFAMKFVKLEKRVARKTKLLADFYCQLAFAKKAVDSGLIQRELKQLWILLEEPNQTTGI